jgi:2,4-dienoyl-CoA reductase-like NADH-dependent reductase (Old Yellow Enzyme family)
MTLRETTFRNRLWVAAMCMYSTPDGIPGRWHARHLSQFAVGGAGLIMTEATAVSPEGRISPRDAGIWSDAHRDAWAEIVADVHEAGARAGMQLAHAGRKASTWWPFSGRSGYVTPEEGGWSTVGPSAIGYADYPAPQALDEAGIAAVVADHVAAARRAVDAGFDVLEVHAAHGYLLHQFLSPLTNHRTDAWGGSPEARAALVVAVVKALREEVGDSVALFVRFSGTDGAEGGLTADDVAQAAAWVREAGADLCDISSGGLVPQQVINAHPGYQVPLAETVRAAAGPVAAVGIIIEPEQAEGILEAGQADAIFAARAWLRNPHLGLAWSNTLGGPADLWPPQYERASRPVKR